MIKQYIKIEINELHELIKSDLLLGYYKNRIDDYKNYDELDDATKYDLNRDLENSVKYYIKEEEFI